MATTQYLTPLPGVETLRPATELHINIGSLRAGGKGFDKGDKFRITQPSPEDASRYVIVKELQDLLCEVTGQDEPQWVPIRIWSRSQDRFLRVGRSLHAGRGQICHSVGYDLKDKATCSAQRLRYPPPDPNFVGEDYYLGQAEWTTYGEEKVQSKRGEITRNVRTSISPRVCDPHCCPFATGNLKDFEGDAQAAPYLNQQKGKVEAERGGCKRRTVLTVELDLPGTCYAGTLAKFTSTGFYTAMYLHSSLAQIADDTAGWIAGLPLKLVLGWTPPVNSRGGGKQKQPYVRFGSRIPTDQLRLMAREHSAELSEVRARMLALEPHVERMTQEEIDRSPNPAYVALYSRETKDLKTDEEAKTDADKGEVLPPGVLEGEVTADPPEPPPDTPPLDDATALTEEECRKRIAQLTGNGVWSNSWREGQYTKCHGPDDWAELLRKAQTAAEQAPAASERLEV